MHAAYPAGAAPAYYSCNPELQWLLPRLKKLLRYLWDRISLIAKATAATLIGYASFRKEAEHGRALVSMEVAYALLACNLLYVGWTRWMNILPEREDLRIILMTQAQRQEALPKKEEQRPGFFTKAYQDFCFYILGRNNPTKLHAFLRATIALCLGMAMLSGFFDFISVVMGVLRFSDSGLVIFGLTLKSSLCANDIPNSCWKGLLVAMTFGLMSAYQFMLYRVVSVMDALSKMYLLGIHALAMQCSKKTILGCRVPVFKAPLEALVFCLMMLPVFGNAFAYGMQNSWFTQDGIEEFAVACQLAGGMSSTLSAATKAWASHLADFAMVNGAGLSIANSSETLRFRLSYLKRLWSLAVYNPIKFAILTLLGAATTSILLISTRTGFDSREWLYTKPDTPFGQSIAYGLGRCYFYISQGWPHFYFNLRRALKVEDKEIDALAELETTFRSIPKYDDALSKLVFNRFGELLIYFTKNGWEMHREMIETVYTGSKGGNTSSSGVQSDADSEDGANGLGDQAQLLSDASPPPICIKRLEDKDGGSLASYSGNARLAGKVRFYDWGQQLVADQARSEQSLNNVA